MANILLSTPHITIHHKDTILVTNRQGWKDAVIYPDGSLVDPPIAICEVQGYYYMALGAYWLEAVVGMVRLDFGITGMKYVGGEQTGWWAVGMSFHLVDSVLLGAAYAALVWPFLPLLGIPTRTLWGDVLGGLLYGVFLWAVLAMLIAMPMMGIGVFAHRARSLRLPLLSLGLHLAYGALLGLIYIP